MILSILGAGTVTKGAYFIIWTFINDNYVPLLTSNLIIATLLATFAYVQSLALSAGQTTTTTPPHRLLALGGDTGSHIYDWFIGRELNPPMWVPCLGYVDLKTFIEVRPGLMGWQILNLAFVAAQFRNYGRVTDSMILVLFSQFTYVFDSFWNESYILTQIDIITDGFGFMLAFGNVVWVPFTYSLQARYLSVHPQDLGVFAVCGILAVQCLGFWIFRASNSQKNTFRQDPEHPSVRHLPSIKIKSGSKLLAGGWWGCARHVNYFGDWIFSWAYCLPTGIAGYIVVQQVSEGVKLKVVPGEAYGWGMVVTYFYLVYFAVLLVHRQRRDDAKCSLKYGKSWEEYVQRVPSRIVPGLY